MLLPFYLWCKSLHISVLVDISIVNQELDNIEMSGISSKVNIDISQHNTFEL